MKAGLKWICDYLDRPLDAQTVADTLSRGGFPVEEMEQVGDDWLLDVEITSNRPDCLCHLGLARELAAAGVAELRIPGFGQMPTDAPASAVAPPDFDARAGEELAATAALDVLATDACPHYVARIIRQLKIGPSPAWLVKRLETVGLRSVNNVVDITNFVLLECGQPLHAFDLAKLADHRIIVRMAEPDEPFTAIDGTNHKLRTSMLVIADGRRAVALAGVMGGLDSEVGPTTTDVLLESARFDPLKVRRASRATKLSSDSSFRFERGVDPLGVEWASKRAIALMALLAGGQTLSGKLEVGSDGSTQREVTLRTDHCRSVIGLDIPIKRMVELLTQLGLQPRVESTDVGESAPILRCTIPSHRLDLEREIDLVEEIARLYGLDHLEVRPAVSLQIRPTQPVVKARRKIGELLTAQGFFEVVAPSFVPPKLGKPFLADQAEPVQVQADRRKADPMLRPALWPSLLACRKFNQDVGNSDIRLYETAAAWQQTQGKIDERHWLALLADVDQPQQTWRMLRGVIDELLTGLHGRNHPALSVESIELSEMETAARLIIAGREIGRMAIPAAPMLKRFDLKVQVALAEIDLDWLVAAYPPITAVGELARFPGIERDLSIVVDEQVPWSDIERSLVGVNPALLEKLEFLVTYRGKPIPPTHKSVSFRMTFRDPGRTLRHEEVDPQVQAVIDKLKADVGAELRA